MFVYSHIAVQTCIFLNYYRTLNLMQISQSTLQLSASSS
eukprot:SAG31_NODE_5308_length_2619_cov_2.319048_4_plen_38_part_01